MANTVIQLKFSTLTATPTSLNVAEPAYSYASNTLFIGSPDGTGSIAIGGKFYIDKFEKAYNHANAAFDLANTVANAGADIYARNHANAAYIQANAAFIAANSAGVYANGAFVSANSAGVYANGAFAAANNEAGVNATQNTNITTAQNTATAAFIRANNSLNANTGGTITGSLTVFGGDLAVTGNLIINGNTITQNVSTLNIADPLIFLAANNTVADDVDIGFSGTYFDGSERHAGLFRDAGNKEFYVFNNYDKNPVNNLIDINDASFRVSTLNANLKSQSIALNGQDLQTLVYNSYNTANAAFISANNINGVNLTQNTNITAAFDQANAAFAAANAAGSSALVQYAANHANAAFNQANTDFTTIATTAGYYGNGATIASFTLEANGRISQANSTLIGISASQITSGTLGVARGGTGASSFSTKGVIVSDGASGTGALSALTSATEGHVLQINSSGVPTFAHLNGGFF
jgi:hypothetical protein